MSEPTTTSTGPVVRGAGNAPGQPLGEAMPSVTTQERGSLDSMADHFRRKNEEARARASQPQQPQQRPVANKQAPSRMSEFQAALEQQQAQQRAPQQTAEQQPQNVPPDPSKSPPEHGQLVDGQGAPQEGQAQGEQQAQEAEEAQPQADPTQLDDATAAAKYRELMQGDMFPDELLGRLHEVKANGMTRYVDTKELRQGYVRGVDYRRQQVEFTQAKQQHEAERGHWQNFFETIRDPQQADLVLEREGYGEMLDQLTMIRAQRIAERRQVVHAAGLAEMQRLGTQDPNDHRVRAAMEAADKQLRRARELEMKEHKLQWQEQQLQRQRQQSQHQLQVEQARQQYEHQLNQLRPLALRAYGVQDNASNRMRFAYHLLAAVQTSGSNEITRELCMQAAQDLSDELQDIRERSAGQQGVQKARSAALPPNRSGVATGKMLGPNAPKRGSLDDLERMVREGRQRNR